jgi:DNA-binding transcriptional MerR regulator
LSAAVSIGFPVPVDGAGPEESPSLALPPPQMTSTERDAAEGAKAAPPKEYSIDDLAAVTRVPSRTIRFYQSKGVLPRPELRGRVAFYTDVHVERLKLVAELQDRGLQIKAIGAIGELVTRMDKGELAINEWLGLEDQLKEPWANDRPRLVDAEELRTLAGDPRPGRISDLVRARLVERRGESFLVHSPALLQVAVRLETVGLDLEVAVAAGEILRRNLGRAVKELVDHFVRNADAHIDASGDAVRTLRPLAIEAVRVIFAQEMERALRKMVESGQTTKLAKRKK